LRNFANVYLNDQDISHRQVRKRRLGMRHHDHSRHCRRTTIVIKSLFGEEQRLTVQTDDRRKDQGIRSS
jgi:hypothetical protein